MSKKDNCQYRKWTKKHHQMIDDFLRLNIQMQPQEFLRKWQGVTVSELADLLQVEETRIYSWLSPKGDSVSKCTLLKVGLVDLFFELYDVLPEELWHKYSH